MKCFVNFAKYGIKAQDLSNDLHHRSVSIGCTRETCASQNFAFGMLCKFSTIASVVRLPIFFLLASGTGGCFPYWLYINLKSKLSFMKKKLTDFKIPEVNARAPSSEPVESGSDTDRDEARMAAEMVGGRTWLEGEWFPTESETSGHQVGSQPNALGVARGESVNFCLFSHKHTLTSSTL